MAIAISALGSVYTQDFDTLPATGTALTTLPEGWAFSEAGTNANTTYAAGTGSANAGNTYSFGAVNSSERAFGGLQSGALVPTIGASFTNATAATITSLQLAYTGEQWRRGTLGLASGADRLDFQYSLNATSLSTGTWTDVDALDFVGPIFNASSAGALDGNLAANRTALNGTISGLSLAPGATIWIRWASFDITGADDSLAIDDFSLTAQGAIAAPSVNLSVSRSDGAEADGTVVTVTVTLSRALDTEASVQLNVGGSGITASDYTLSAASITIPAGLTQASVVFTVLDDALYEGPETAQLSIGAPSAGVELGGTTQRTIVISDNEPPPATRIHEIQGAGHLSPRAGQAVYGVQGIVTAIASNGFYLQDPIADDNPATSEGLFVFTGSGNALLLARSVGEAVKVSGTVQEFRPGGGDNLTTTELVGDTNVLSLSVEAWADAPAGGIAATVLGVDRHPPGEIINDDFAVPTSVENAGDFDPATEGIDFWESLEGMWVQVNAPVAVSPTLSSGTTGEEIWVLADGGAAATGRTARGGVAVSDGDFNPERLQLDDLNNDALVFPLVDVGARLATIAGAIDYSGGNFELRVPTVPVVVTASPLTREVSALSGGSDWLRVATFNVENLDPGDPASKFQALAAAIVSNLGAPEILSLEEVQDNTGPVRNDGVVDASVTLQMLVDAIEDAGGPTYSWRQIDPAPGNLDGGEVGGNIRQVLFFNAGAGVTFVEGSLQRLADGNLSDGDAFANSRKPLVGRFEFNGQVLTVVSNHFNSKGGDGALFGAVQPPVLESEATRLQQAGVVAGYVEGLLADDPDALVLVAGDLNDFEFSPPVSRLEAAGLDSLIETLPENERYTYNFQGNAQVLDHLMTSAALSALLDGFDVVHLNSEFASQMSDHDPVLARFFIERPGEVFNGTKSRDTITGTSGADLITGGRGRDDITTGSGNDVLVLSSVLDGLDVVRDFDPARDRIDIRPLLASVLYAGSDPIADGMVLLQAGSDRSTLLFDADGLSGAGVPRPLVELLGVVDATLASLLLPALPG